MFATLKKDWKFIDGETMGTVVVPSGRHEIERIPSPSGYPCDWLVLKGTKIGSVEAFWRDWVKGDDNSNPGSSNPGWDEFEIIIEEE
ncbi:hypothetical protein HY797_01280 [Candidatus Falkowbacteria bacterium]|nr:hypothetical protein [Candidatus Falkowbacteria bacterium]